jgi:hypothetical protein
MDDVSDSLAPKAERDDDLLMVLEGLASVTALGATAFLFFNWSGTHPVLSDKPVLIAADDVYSYWALVCLLVVSVVATFTLSGVRRATRAWRWHLTVAGLGVAAALLFTVSNTGTGHNDPDPDPVQHPRSPCYGGSDRSGCL